MSTWLGPTSLPRIPSLLCLAKSKPAGRTQWSRRIERSVVLVDQLAVWTRQNESYSIEWYSLSANCSFAVVNRTAVLPTVKTAATWAMDWIRRRVFSRPAPLLTNRFNRAIIGVYPFWLVGMKIEKSQKVQEIPGFAGKAEVDVLIQRVFLGYSL